MKCKNCGNELVMGQPFCPTCGERVNLEENDGAQRVSTGESFSQSLKNDIGNSESINMIKTSVNGMNKGQKKKIGIIAAVVIVLVVAISIFTHINTCDNCDKTYVGKKHYVIIWGEGGNLCNDCFRRYVLDD